MSNEEQDSRASGSVPNAFGNALAWKWTRSMPPAVRRSGLPTLLYALRAMANAAGELRFTGDRKPIRIQDIAKAACCDEKDARRYLEAAEKAGVVMVRGERRRGRPTLYIVVPQPWPDWGAAAAHLEATKRDRPGRKPGPWTENTDTEVQGAPPELDETKVQGTAPGTYRRYGNESSGDRPPYEFGGRPPNGSGDRPPNNPGDSQETTHERAEVSFQPQVDGPTGQQIDSQDNQPRADPAADAPQSGWIRCARCRQPLIPRNGRTTHPHCQPAPAPERTPT